MALDNTDPVFLTIVSKLAEESEPQDSLLACSLCRGADISRALQAGARLGVTTAFVTAANVLADSLKGTEPRYRGRGA